MQFPVVTSENLSRRTLTLPADFEGQVNILLIAFQRWQQDAIDTWLPLARQLEHTYEGVRYYELPVIQRINVLGRAFINQGMRAGIRDQTARDRTITLYLDKAAFRQALELPHEEDIYVLVVNRQGDVLWRTEGAFAPDKGDSLAAAVRGER